MVQLQIAQKHHRSSDILLTSYLLSGFSTSILAFPRNNFYENKRGSRMLLFGWVGHQLITVKPCMLKSG